MSRIKHLGYTANGVSFSYSDRSVSSFFDHYGLDVEQFVGWVCDGRLHLDPETGEEFRNDPDRDTCEICTRARPRGREG